MTHSTTDDLKQLFDDQFNHSFVKSTLHNTGGTYLCTVDCWTMDCF